MHAHAHITHARTPSPKGKGKGPGGLLEIEIQNQQPAAGPGPIRSSNQHNSANMNNTNKQRALGMSHLGVVLLLLVLIWEVTSHFDTRQNSTFHSTLGSFRVLGFVVFNVQCACGGIYDFRSFVGRSLCRFGLSFALSAPALQPPPHTSS